MLSLVMPEDCDSDNQDDDQGEILKGLTKTMPRKVNKHCNRLYGLFLVGGALRSEALAKVCELFSPQRVTKEIRSLPRLHLKGGSTFDLEGDEFGRKWNFLKADDRAKCRSGLKPNSPLS